ncbi:MAG: plasmid pRiA4b ORF-3 family protein [Verrucomicrobia bacterium]|nr:plasmid pRiA4b ORF-3 family protein [Verrucomicrobiota bacterium]
MPKTRASRGVWVPPPDHVFQLRVSLRYIQPPIWRRFLVPDNWLLGELHPVLVAVMGWGGYHMHAFRFGGGFNPTEYSTVGVGTECDSRVRDENQVLIGHLIRRRGQTFSYEYDFGDSWQHEVKVEKILPFDPGVALPVCLAGERACPPEDCGSVPGYAEVLRVLQKVETPKERQLLDWVGKYDPERFDLEAVNRRLRPPSARKSS